VARRAEGEKPQTKDSPGRFPDLKYFEHPSVWLSPPPRRQGTPPRIDGGEAEEYDTTTARPRGRRADDGGGILGRQRLYTTIAVSRTAAMRRSLAVSGEGKWTNSCSGRAGRDDVVFVPRGNGTRPPPSFADPINYRAKSMLWNRRGRRHRHFLFASRPEDRWRRGFAARHRVVDQFMNTAPSRARHKSFFGDGGAAHVSMAHPTCGPVAPGRSILARARGALPSSSAAPYGDGKGTDNSPASPNAVLYRSFGLRVIGMDKHAEAKLAREAEICYVPVAMVTDSTAGIPIRTMCKVFRHVAACLLDNAEEGPKGPGRNGSWPPASRSRGAEPLSAGCDRTLDSWRLITPHAARSRAMIAKARCSRRGAC